MMEIVIGIVATHLVDIAIRYLKRFRFWQRVRLLARRILDEDNPVTDPREAAERALVEAQRGQLDAIERSLRNGGNGFHNGH